VKTQTSAVLSRPLVLDVDGITLNGDLSVPAAGDGLVIFVHGSGSTRHSPRNKAVAEIFQEAQLATLLVDLLTDNEARVDAATAEFRFDIPLLADRVAGVIEWMRAYEPTAKRSIGLFGASTGAAAALIAAARLPAHVRAVVSRGGRADLANDSLESVTAPTLLVVGGEDDVVLQLNRDAYKRLNGPKRLNVIPNASHLFEEPGALERVAELARAWFIKELRPQR
jgi:pimeloyl-ACP methyl ester carboxylesterase